MARLHSGDIDKYGLTYALDITELRGIPGSFDGQMIQLSCLNTAGDGRGGSFHWSGSSVSADDGYSVIGSFLTGRWLRDPSSGFLQSGTGAVSRTVQSKLRDVVSVFDFMTTAQIADVQSGTPTIDLTSVFTTAVAAATALFFPAGSYLGALSIRKNGFSLLGAGSAVTTIKAPAGALAPGGVVECGDTASGNSATAYSGVVVRGLKLDGNSANTTRPLSDITGWGLSFTKVSNFEYDDIVAVNCWQGGIGIFINSNYGVGNGYSESCGVGSIAVGGKPGLDVNSSKFLQLTHVSKTDQYGGRLLDNCWGNQVRLSADTPVHQAFVYSNQTINESYSNTVVVDVVGGCSDVGVSVGTNCRDSIIGLTAEGLTGPSYHGLGVTSGLSAANVPTNNVVTISSKSGQVQAAIIEDNATIFTISSNLDGRSGAAGDYYAVDVYGNNNTINAIVQEGSAFQVRGLAFRAGATDNIVSSLQLLGNTSIASQYNDNGTRNIYNRGIGMGADIASTAGAIDLPLNGSTFNLTGISSVLSINTPAAHKGRTVVFITPSTAGFTDGNNLKLAGNFGGSADDTITLVCDGTNFYEVCRSVN